MYSADNLRVLWELAKSGSPIDTARRLGVDRTTVTRRIDNLERSAGERLFDRSGSGWVLTEAGRRMLPYAEAIEAAAVNAFEDARGEGILKGEVRVVAPDGFGAYVPIPGLVPLCRRHTQLHVEVVTATVHAALTMRDWPA